MNLFKTFVSVDDIIKLSVEQEKQEDKCIDGFPPVPKIKHSSL